jgi:hypothetical protein
MPVVPENVGQVLVQRAAERDVEHLHAPTDPQHRQPPVQRAPQQRELPGVAGNARLVGGRMRLLAVRSGVEVITSGDHQRVQAVEHGADDLGVDRLRRQQHRDTAGHDDALEVISGQIARGDVPDPGPYLLQVTGQAHHRTPRGVQNHASSPNR